MMKKASRKTRRQLLAEKESVAKELVDKANALRDPLEHLHSFHEYTTKDNLVIKLSCMRAREAQPDCVLWIFDIMERNMKQKYEQCSWGWDPVGKQEELTEPQAWYLVASADDKFVGFSHFRFDIDDREEVLYCYELQLEPDVRRKGLGYFMLTALEVMARENKMKKVMLTVFKHNPSAIQFFYARGYKLDKTSPCPAHQLDYLILSKQNLH